MIESHVEYLGRMVSVAHFRAFVYSNNKDVQPLLVESYPEFCKAIASGEWLDKPYVQQEELGKKEALKKSKGALDADS